MTRFARMRVNVLNVRATAAAVLLLWIAAAAWAQGAAAPPPALLQALNALRSAGCEGRAGVVQRLAPDPVLDRAARLVAQGQPLAQALRAAGYRANQSLQIALSGLDVERDAAAATRFMASRYCADLLRPELRAMGLHRQGARAWLVFGAPFAPPPTEQAETVAEEVLARVNAARAQPRACGTRRMRAAGPLRLNATLTAAGQAHARDMARQNYFSHTGRDGSAPADRVTRAGYPWRAVGENIAAGQQSAAEVVAGWLASPGHCLNIMQRDFTEMGVAFVVDSRSDKGIYWAQVFGTPR